MHSRLTISMQKELHEGRMGARYKKVPQTQQTTVMETSKRKGHPKVSFLIMHLWLSYATIGTCHQWQSRGQIRHTQMNNTQHEHATRTASRGNTTSNRTRSKVQMGMTRHRQMDKRHEVDEWMSDKWHEWDSTHDIRENPQLCSSPYELFGLHSSRLHLCSTT
jgi:hypothetical protein